MRHLHALISNQTHHTCLSSVFKYIRREVVPPSRTPNLIAFFIILILSFIGAIGLTALGTSRNGKGPCGDLAHAHPEKCTRAAVAITFTWVAVMFGASSALVGPIPCQPYCSLAGWGLAVSWLDRNSEMGLHSPYDHPLKELKLPTMPSTIHSSHSHGTGPSESYIPRPRDPYDTPGRPGRTNPRRAPSRGRKPVSLLPSLPSDPVGPGPSSEAVSYTDGGRSNSTRPKRQSSKDLPGCPPPTRRPSKDKGSKELSQKNHLSVTSMYAQLG